MRVGDEQLARVRGPELTAEGASGLGRERRARRGRQQAAGPDGERGTCERCERSRWVDLETGEVRGARRVPVLQRAQHGHLTRYGVPTTWLAGLARLPNGPT